MPDAMNDAAHGGWPPKMLLTTKLFIPPGRTGLVLRQRLVERLHEGLRKKLTLVSAPAGFGKTTLLSEWINTGSIRAAWISLDTSDNDIIRFLSYVIAALQTIDPEIGTTSSAMLPSPERSHVETLLVALINDAAALPDHMVLVLDDYHTIEAQPIHDAVAFLLDHLPPQIHFYIATRSDPPLPIARLRGRGELNELRAADLRFSLDETSALLKDVMRLEVTGDDVAELTARTEGWITGLQMAAFSMQDSEDIRGFIQAFKGSNRYILDYLIEEVLLRQPEDIQSFLVETAILERLTGPLCAAVTGRSDSQAVLDQLNRANLFLEPLDNEQRWYRYHRLFADLLQQRLRQMQPNLVPTLHRRASLWYQQNGLIAEAIHHALSARDFDRAAALIEEAMQAIWARGEIATPLNWLKAFPDDVIRARPLLCIYHATLLLLEGLSFSDVESRIEDVSKADTAGQFVGELTALRAILAMLRGDIQLGFQLSQQTLPLLPEDNLFRGLVIRNLSVLYLLMGDVATADTLLEEDVRTGQRAGDLLGASASLRRLGSLHMVRGQLRRARELYQRALDISVDSRGQRWPTAGRILYHLGELMFEWNDLEAATRYLTEGIHLIEKKMPAWNIGNYLVLSRVKQAQGDTQGAQQAMEMARQLASETETELDDFIVGAYEVHLWLAQGNLDAAVQWATEHRPWVISMPDVPTRTLEGHEPYYLHEMEQMTLARIYLAQRQATQALAILVPLLEKAERIQWMGFVIEILALQALAFEAQGQDEQALDALRRALCLAEPEGYVRLFVSEGPAMARLLYKAAARGITPAYAGRLLAAFPTSTPSVSQRQAGLVEPLSARELEILRLVAAGVSNPEIAEQLVISVNTVKKHVTNIFGKLAVTTRTQAVARARTLKLIE